MVQGASVMWKETGKTGNSAWRRESSGGSYQWEKLIIKKEQRIWSQILFCCEQWEDKRHKMKHKIPSELGIFGVFLLGRCFGPDCPERWWSFHSWRYQNPAGHWTTCSKQVFGVDNLSKIQNFTILGFCGEEWWLGLGNSREIWVNSQVSRRP